MKREGFPWISLILLCLCSFSFKYNIDTSALHHDGMQGISGFTYDGMPIAKVILGIICIIFTFKATNQIQDVLLIHKLIARKIKSRYEKLLPFIIIIPALGYTAVSGDIIKSIEGKPIDKWILKWGQSESHIWVILFFLFFLLLHRLLLILHEMERTKG